MHSNIVTVYRTYIKSFYFLVVANGMKNQNEALVDFFNRAIQKNMQKVDSSNFEQRAIVYRAAFSSLQKVHSKNPTLSEAVKKHQVEIVSSVVEHTENQFLHHKKEQV